MSDLKRAEILDKIPFRPDNSRIMTRLRFHFSEPNNELEEKMADAVGKVVPIVRPKAIYQVGGVTEKARDSIYIEGVKFASYLLRVNLDRADKVFLFAATCGQEIDSIQIPEKNEIKHYCLDLIKEMALTSAINFLRNYLAQSFKLDYLWSLSPGEYQAWPNSYQRTLLSLLDSTAESIGIKIAADDTLIPSHSCSGMFYYFPTDFENCVLCDQVSCMFRRAPFNPDLARKYPEKTRKGCSR